MANIKLKTPYVIRYGFVATEKKLNYVKTEQQHVGLNHFRIDDFELYNVFDTMR